MESRSPLVIRAISQGKGENGGIMIAISILTALLITISVPDDYETVQEAIEEASDGDDDPSVLALAL